MAGRKGSVLVVEDEKSISSVIKAYLEREGYKAVVAEDGEKALKVLGEGFDLVILDLMLPGIQGEELCALIRQDSDVPIIMLTAKSAEEERVKGLGMGADDYVVKPFSPRELVARVNAQLRRTKKRPGVMSFNGGSLVLNIENHEVRKDGRVVPLTPTEFKILQVLAERPEAVLSRLQLVNLVQGYDFEGYERTTDAHVKNLRQKIEDNPRDPAFIRTVYGVGYKFTGKRDED
ncbi:MAG: response regulator transcription factor [Thermodesulfovibrionales bacterium]